MSWYDFSPLLILTGVFFLIWDAPREQPIIRLVAASLPVVALAPYLAWRIDSTLVIQPAQEQVSAAQWWIWVVWAFELIAIVEVSVFLLIMCRFRSRSAEADACEIELLGRNEKPSVDVFIPTYNEPIDVLEKTIIGAMGIEYENKTVWVLDDGKRDWLRDFCDRHPSLKYLRRPDNKHAKAGNLNHALQYSTGDFICVFDADFVPGSDFIRRTVGLFADQTIGIVQTPQHFYNKDPIQTNLGLTREYPDEQRLFFDHMAASRDAWNVSFCCGSCSIMRREALVQAGGIPTESITEDLLTTLVMIRKGYRTIYLNERLSMGLAAESVEGYFVQRERWCRGAIQSLFLKSGPLGSGLTPLQRLFFFPTGWLTQYFVRLALLLIPLMYLLFGFMPLHFTSTRDLIFYQLPMIASLFLSARWLVGTHYSPLISFPTSIFTSFRMAPTVVASLVKPFGQPFRVTPKGSLSVGGKRVDFTTLIPIIFTLGLTLLGLWVNIVPELAVVPFSEFFPIAAFWAGLNVFGLIMAALLCFEAPRPRKEERFEVLEPTTYVWEDGRIDGLLQDLSLSGLSVRCTPATGGVPRVDSLVRVCIPGVGEVQVRVLRSTATEFSGPMETTAQQREALIRKLFSGRYSNQVTQVRPEHHLLRRLWIKALH